MKRTSLDRRKVGLFPLLAGLLLFWVGWSANSPTPVLTPPSLLAVGPGEPELVSLKGIAPTPVPQVPGRWQVSTESSVELRRQGWPSKQVRIPREPGVTALRLPAPRATLSVAVKGDDSAEVSMVSLPKKSEIPTAQGQTRLEAGPHELLVSAEGYLPQRLSVNLIPGEVKKVTLDLKAVPGFPFGLPNLPSSVEVPVPPSVPPSVSGIRTAPPVRQTWEPPTRPVVRQPPPVQPVPRFTPVAPPPRVGTPDPVPLFTPIGP